MSCKLGRRQQSKNFESNGISGKCPGRVVPSMNGDR